jgi:hypothetical protein
MLTRRIFELNAQFELLSQIAQEHKRRAEDLPRDQAPKVQCEIEFARELETRAASILTNLNNTGKERTAFEQAHPNYAGPGLPNPFAGLTNGPTPDEIAFLGKLEDRAVDLRRQIAETIEAGRIYAAQLRTNTASYEYARIASFVQENGNAVRQLQRELTDLELRELEFRALRRR